jgi:hypothetical protein
MRVFLLLMFAAMMLPSCASLGKNCVEWAPKSTYYALRAGAIDRIDVFTCMAFHEVP